MWTFSSSKSLHESIYTDQYTTVNIHSVPRVQTNCNTSWDNDDEQFYNLETKIMSLIVKMYFMFLVYFNSINIWILTDLQLLMSRRKNPEPVVSALSREIPRRRTFLRYYDVSHNYAICANRNYNHAIGTQIATSNQDAGVREEWIYILGD
jgi:hypothetical protein